MGEVRITVLGIAQDGGAPQPGCAKPCCTTLRHKGIRHAPAGIGIEGVDGSRHLIDISRAIGDWLEVWGASEFASISLTHGHLGHIDGLGMLGCEVMNMDGVALYGSSKMIDFIGINPLHADLIEAGRVKPQIIDGPYAPSPGCGFTLEWVRVPHRDEHTDTGAFLVRGPKHTLLYLPDHDTWEETLGLYGATSIRKWLSEMGVDIALIDGTFWDDSELGRERMQNVPHPRVKETLNRLSAKQLGDPDLQFIHLNHTNPLLLDDAPVRDLGWAIAAPGDVHAL